MGTEIVLIGGSAGSIKVLLEIIPQLAPDLSFPIVLVLHRQANIPSSLDRLFGLHSHLPIVEIGDKCMLEPGSIYLVPADYHVLFEDKKMVSLDVSEKVNFSRPSIDVVFNSAARIFKDGIVAFLLSGSNKDGVDGLISVKKMNGKVYVQDPDSAEVDVMPKEALENVVVDGSLNPKKIVILINQLKNQL